MNAYGGSPKQHHGIDAERTGRLGREAGSRPSRSRNRIKQEREREREGRSAEGAGNLETG